jgi:hypothetical protein
LLDAIETTEGQAWNVNFAAIQDFAHSASHVGAWVLRVTLSVMFFDGLALVIYAIRHGASDGEVGKTETVGRPMSPVWLKGFGTWRGRSRRRILASHSASLSYESLADGTATPTDRLVVVGIKTFIVSFALMWVGLGMWKLEDKPWVLLMAIAVCVWGFNVLRSGHKGQLAADEKVAARKHPEA